MSPTQGNLARISSLEWNIGHRWFYGVCPDTAQLPTQTGDFMPTPAPETPENPWSYSLRLPHDPRAAAIARTT
ncbi:hypothetical protein ACWGJ7_40420, partial [Streptomyces tendae]